MTSERKILANRQNAQKSTGPKTTTGKSRASRNAVQHGLEGMNFGNPGYCVQVERLAKAICPGASDPFRYEQAIIIAESQMFVARVRAARVAAIERIRNSAVEPLRPGNIQRVTNILRLSTKALREATKLMGNAAKIQEYRDNLIQSILLSQVLHQEIDKLTPQTFDETERLSRALPELLSFERYERRALSRRKRAIRAFDALGG